MLTMLRRRGRRRKRGRREEHVSEESASKRIFLDAWRSIILAPQFFSWWATTGADPAVRIEGASAALPVIAAFLE
eukprot:4876516-Pyramimonas_sp.AAC.1